METQDNCLRLKGALNVSNIVAVCESARSALDQGEVVADFAEVTEVDSTALSLIFEWRRIARHSKSRITFRNLPASLLSLAALYGVSDLLIDGK